MGRFNAGGERVRELRMKRVVSHSTDEDKVMRTRVRGQETGMRRRLRGSETG